MKKTLLLIYLMGICSFGGYAQGDFILSVETDKIDVKDLSLELSLDSIYYENIYVYELEKKEKNTFLFKGKQDYPYSFFLLIDSSYYSPDFVVYPGNNRMKLLKIEDGYKMIRLDHHSQDQNIHVYRSWFQDDYGVLSFLRAFDQNETLGKEKLSVIRDSLLIASYDRTDSVLYMFTEDHPDSYFSLWYLNRLLKFGYKPLMSDIFDLYNTDLKKTYLGNLTKQLIGSRNKLRIGSILPNGEFENIGKEKIYLHSVFSDHKITLVDFWYHNCAPCLAKIPFLKRMLKRYESAGFAIVNISTDRGDNIPKWKETSQRHSIDWLNVLDIHKLHKDRYGVEVYPFTFLVDDKGQILKVNPTDSELEETIKDILILE